MARQAEADSVQSGRRWSALFGTPMGVVGLLGIAALLSLAVTAPLLWGEAATAVDPAAQHLPPSSAHPLGTDSLGRDELARLLVATRLTLELGLSAAALGFGVGVLFGSLPAVLPARLGRVVVGSIDVLLAFPGLLLALFLAVTFGVGGVAAVLAIGCAMVPAFARLTYTLAASTASKEYVSAARVVGVGRLTILRTHVLPNIVDTLIINASLAAGGALVAFAGLSFLGVGVQPPAFDWGRLLNESLQTIYVNPTAALAPGIMVTLAGVIFTLFGESLAAVAGLREGGARLAGWTLGSLGRSPEVVREPSTGPTGTGDDMPVLSVRNLGISFRSDGHWSRPVRDVSLEVRAGEMVGIVGESGSGKSLTALAVAGLVDGTGTVRASSMEFCGHRLAADGNLLHHDRALRQFLGRSMAVVFQDPATSLNPAMRVGRQLAEVAEVHCAASRRSAWERAVDRMRAVHISNPVRRVRQFPHEFSGGMRQRAVIAMGLMATPRLIIADEPTSALDVIAQRRVLRVLDQTRQRLGTSIILISHDIAVTASVCDRIAVMYAGAIVEDGTAEQIVQAPAHPYTAALLRSIVDMDTDRDAPLASIPGSPPDPSADRTGCSFAPRCPAATERCQTDPPELEAMADAHLVACWHPLRPAR